MLDQKLIHGGHQVLTWNVADAVVMIDPAHGRKIAKDKSVDRVDGLVALAMAIGLYNRELAPIEYDFDRALILKKELLGAMSMDQKKETEQFKAELQKDIEVFRATLQTEVDRAKAQLDAHYDHWRMTAQSEREIDQAMLRGIIEFALAALKGITLINGAAAIAILAFLGNIWDPDQAGAKMAAALIKPAMQSFVVGTAAGVFAIALSYLAQVFFRETKKRWLGECFRISAVLVAAGGLVAFGLGAVWAVDAFTTSGP